jgi:16S rRNA (guanine527-N7)-methyltransferase
LPGSEERPSASWIRDRLTLAAAPGPPPGLDERAAERLARYVGLLLAWNRRIRLTGARSAEAVVDEHVADALPLLTHLPASPCDLVDVGSGAGFPGLVLGILRPGLRCVLLEPVSKKQAFLATAVRELSLEGVHSLRERLEEHVRTAARYDVAVSRAVWPAAEWLERGRPLVRPGGVVLGLEGATRGPLPEGAVRHPYQRGGRELAVLALRLPAGRDRDASAPAD